MAENPTPAPQPSQPPAAKPTPAPARSTRAAARGFDEQLWPVNVALLVLTGFVAGIIIAAGGFDDARFFHNGWVRLVSLAISMALLLVATVKFKYAVGRRLQLAALVSLIIHVGVAVVLRDQYIEMAAAQKEQDGEDVVEQRELPTMPDYSFSQPTPVPSQQPVENELATPVPTETLQIEPEQAVPTEKQPPQPGPVREAKPAVTPDQVVVPGAANIERQPVAAPHRSDQTSKLSKQTELARQQPQAAADIAEPKAPGRDAVAGVTSPLTPAARQPAAMRLGRQDTLGEPQTPVQAEGARAPNRANPQQTEIAISATPTLPRKIGAPSVLPRADAPRDVAARAAQRDAAQVEAPNPTMLVRSQAAGPAVARPVIEPGPRSSATVATPEPPRQQPADVAPTLARTDRPTPNRRAIETVDATATPAAPRGVGNSTEPSTQPVPRPTSVARGESNRPGMIRGPLEPGAAAPGSPAPAATVAVAETPRPASNSAAPQIAAANTATPTPTRAVAQPGAVGSGAALPAVAVASNSPTTAGAPGPRSTEVARIATQIPSRADGPPSAGSAGAPAAPTAPAIAARPGSIASTTPGDRPGAGGGTGTGGGPGGGSGPSGKPQRGAGPAVAIASTAQADGTGVGAGSGASVAGGATALGPAGVAVGRGQSAGPGATGAPGTGGTAVAGVAPSAGSGVASRQPGYSGVAGPSVGQGQQTIPGRRADSGALAGAGAADAPATGIAMSESRGSGVPGPVSQQVARAAAQVPGLPNSQPEASSSPRVEQGSGIAAAVGARAANADAPTLTAGSGSGGGLGGTGPSGTAARRAAPTTLAAGTAAEGPASTGGAPQATGAAPSVGPAGVAVGRAASAAVGGGAAGTGGVGGESGLASSAGPASSTALAMAGARRVAATPGVAGPIGAPGESARIARGIAGSGVASATAEAQDVAVGDIAGSREPALVTNPANSDVARGVATGPVGGNIGGNGDATVPGGAPQVVANIGGGPATGGAGRGAGGDQPAVDGAQAGGGAGVPRSGSGGATLAAANADNVGSSAAGAGGAGAGAGPLGPALGDEGKRSAGGGTLAAVQPDMTPGAGAAGEVGGGAGAATIARAGSGAAGGGGLPEVGSASGGPGVAKANGGGAVALAATAADVAQPGTIGAGDAGGGSSPQPQVAGIGNGQKEPGGGPTIVAPAGSGAAAGAEGVPASVATSALARAGQAGGAVGGGEPEIGSAAGDMKLARSPGNAAVVGGAAADVAASAGPVGAGGRGVGEGGGPQLAASAVGGGERTAGGLPAGIGVGGANVAVAEGGGGVDVAAEPIQRAGSTEALPGVEAGGGTAQPARGQPRPAAALAAADVPQNESIPQSGGAAVGEPLDAPGTEVSRVASGVPGKVTAGTAGAEGALVAVDSSETGAIGSQVTMSKVSSGNAPTLAVGNAADAAAPLKKGNVAILPGGVATDVADPQLAMASAGGGEGDEGAAGVTIEVGLAERTAGSLPVRVVAVSGPGGLGDTLTPDVGVPGRRAQSESQVVHQVPDRFLAKKVGGASVVGGMARDEAQAFAKRGRRTGDSPGGLGQLVLKTDTSIEQGVDFLSRQQGADGSWSFNYGEGRPGFENESAAIHSNTAATGLSLLAFLGAGYDHYDDKHQERVKSGLNYLVRHQQPNGDLYVPTDQTSNGVAQLYSHGIATIALCEAYGMTGDPELGKAAQKAIDFIVAAQHKERGGWRYTPNYMADLSVSGWQLMALKSGELAGLNVPKSAYDKVQKFLDLCTGAKSGGALYVYNPYAANEPATRHGREPSTVMTSVGLLMRMYTGWNRTTPQMQRGAQHLLENLPQVGSANNLPKTGTFANPMRDTYYWYYTTQVMFHMKGQYWKTWSEQLRPLLLESQIKQGIFAGSWDPKGPVPDKWGPQGGRIYVTTMNLLSLEVTYRHLPIYESTAK